MRGTRTNVTWIGLVSLECIILSFFVHFRCTDQQTVTNEPEVESTIRKVAIFFRHGERAPTTVNAALNITSSGWPDEFGELTKLGKLNSYNLGKRMRKRYGRILTPYFSKKYATVLSTKIHRTMMSTSLLLGGMYPPVDYQIWNENLLWNPIPVFFDQSLLEFFTCQRYVYEYYKHKSPQMIEQFHELIMLLKNQNVSTQLDKDVFLVYDALTTLESNNVKMDSWMKKMTSTSNKLMVEWMISITSKTFVQRQLTSRCGDHLLKFIDNNKILFVYGNHDITLFVVAGALGVTLETYPLPTATIAVEFHEKNGEQIVRAFYITHYNAPMVPLKMGCGNECTLANFKQMLIDLQPKNYKELCHSLPGPMDLKIIERYITFFTSWKKRQLADL